MSNNKLSASTGAGVSASVDVTKIVKYACITGVLIVAIVFITNCISSIVNRE